LEKKSPAFWFVGVLDGPHQLRMLYVRAACARACTRAHAACSCRLELAATCTRARALSLEAAAARERRLMEHGPLELRCLENAWQKSGPGPGGKIRQCTATNRSTYTSELALESTSSAAESYLISVSSMEADQRADPFNLIWQVFVDRYRYRSMHMRRS